MTLVAAFRVSGVPGLIGDFLITTGEDRERGSKKIERIRPNLAVGWTGRLLQAGAVLRHMYVDLSRRPTYDEVREWFECLDAATIGASKLKLVGWIIDDGGARSFHWDAGTAPFVQWDELAWFIGSGSATAEAFYDAYMKGSSTVEEADERDALDWILGALTATNTHDLMDASSHALGFGGGYEALYWSRSTASFQYVERVLYYIAGRELDALGHAVEGPQQFAESVACYHTIGECSVLDINGVGPNGSRRTWAMSAVGTPVAETQIAEHLRALGQLPADMRADFHAGLLAVRTPRGPERPIPFIQCPWDRLQYVEGVVGGINLRIPPEMFEFVYRARTALSDGDAEPFVRPE
ncbi:MAG TPA: hypothetical protein VGO48_12820 [Conexibacter sp.]|jgi:hypothetical protein|nr:hypothetical protein [Conexibacter sp.]